MIYTQEGIGKSHQHRSTHFGLTSKVSSASSSIRNLCLIVLKRLLVECLKEEQSCERVWLLCEIKGRNHCSRVDVWEDNSRGVIDGCNRKMNVKGEWFITRRRNSNNSRYCCGRRDTTRGKDCCNKRETRCNRREKRCNHVRVHILGAYRV